MDDPQIEKRIRDRADRKLRFRSKMLGASLSFLDLIFQLITIVSWILWYVTTPGLSAWWQAFSTNLNTVSFSTLADRLATFPGGMPWPLFVVVGSRVVFLMVRAIFQLVFNYINFKRVDRVHRTYERALQREMTGVMMRERLTPGWLDSTRDQFDWSSSEMRRRLNKFQRWIQMYDQVPDAPTVEKAKAKRTSTAEQSVRLGEDGELIYDFEDEPEKVHARSAH